jgi:hypothetical protein
MVTMLVMIRGSVTVEALPVEMSILQDSEKKHGNARQEWENRTSRADIELLDHSPSG